MPRQFSLAMIAACLVSSSVFASEIRGVYVEARTCQVYTGPCFANSEVELAGKNAVMSWRIDAGQRQGVDLQGLSVAVVVKASHTLGFRGLADAKTKKCVILVDKRADTEQSQALREFALVQTGIATNDVLAVQRSSIEIQFDPSKLTAALEVGETIKIKARKARPEDCICSNESAYYPPLTELKSCVPGVTIEGEVTARPLSIRWWIPDSRTAYLGVFQLDSTSDKLASR